MLSKKSAHNTNKSKTFSYFEIKQLTRRYSAEVIMEASKKRGHKYYYKSNLEKENFKKLM